MNFLIGNRSKPLSDDERLTDQIIFIGLIINLLLLVGLLLLAGSQGWGFWQLPVLIALGVFSAGALVGFLFGIPKVAASGNLGRSTGDESSERPRRILNVNTNLEDISDWLTKIIVGLGLVELRNIPPAVLAFSRATSSAFHAWNDAAPIAVAIYFPVLGFTSAYLLTRLYVSGLIGRADIRLDRFHDTKDAVTNLVAAASSASLDGSTAEATAYEKVVGAKDTVERIVTPQTLKRFQSSAILWIDDVPSNNRNLIDAFRALGVNVDLSLSTEEALAKIDRGQRYDAIITDMGRPSDLQAGYTSLETLTKRAAHIPVLIFARDGSSEANRKKAQAAGAFDSTSYPQSVFEFVAQAVGRRANATQPLRPN